MRFRASGSFLCLVFLLAAPALIVAQNPAVSSTDPNMAPQGTISLDVTIKGSGFKRGAKAKWFVTGTTNPGGVTVNSTSYVSSSQLVANITVAADAEIAGFDVQVQNNDGRTGVGIDAFTVTQGPGNSCRDIDLGVTFTPMSPGISSDGLGAYVDGQSGVSAKIQMCNGYYDAVIQLGYQNSTRSVSYNFSGSTVNFIPGVTPMWTQSSSSFLAKPLFNVNQIANPNLCPGPACYNPNGNYSFTTYLWNGAITGPDGGTYRLISVSSDPISDTGFGYVNMTSEMINTPYSTSLVRVTHYAATGTSPETWVVVPVANCSGTCAADQYPGFVSTLVSVVQSKKNTTTTTNVGQFAIPFQMTLTRR